MSHEPRCDCGRPVVYTLRRRYSFGVGPLEHVCETCAPAVTECLFFAPFLQQTEESPS